jgi:hypothetical protein
MSEPAIHPALVDVTKLSMTREEVAVRQLAKAATRLRQLETEAVHAFQDFATAQQAMQDVGLVCDIRLHPGISAAFSAWKQDQAAAAGREQAHEE